MHTLRHFYASVLLDAGENIKAAAEYLGHSDPGLTLRVYAHLMPSSRERTRQAGGLHLPRSESAPDHGLTAHRRPGARVKPPPAESMQVGA